MGYHRKNRDDGGWAVADNDSGNEALRAGNPNEGAVLYAGDGGKKAVGILRVAANVADTETVTIGSDVYEFDRSDDGVTAGRIAVTAHSDDTPANATDALIAKINSDGTEPVTAVDIGDNEILVYADAVGATTTALAETMAGTNNAWDTAALRGGADPALKRYVVDSRVPNAQEVALGNLHIVLPFTPTYVDVLVTVTSTGASKAWDGVTTIESGRVELDNSGSTDWAATDTVRFIAYE